MFCPISPKKSKLENYCIICNEDSCSADNDGELTNIFLNYLFPQSDKEEITIKLLRLFTFCENCGHILDGLIELHKNLECIQNDIKRTVHKIKCFILKNCDDEKITDIHIRKFRKIATRDYCPVVTLKKPDVLQNKSISIARITEESNKDVPRELQLQRYSISVEQSKPNGQTSFELLKLLNKKSCDIRRDSLSLDTCSRSNATTLSPTDSDIDVTGLERNQHDVDPIGPNSFYPQTNSEYNVIANNGDFSGLQRPIKSEVIIQMESNFNFQEEEEAVKFEPWDQQSLDQEAGNIYTQDESHQQEQIMGHTQEIHSGNCNVFHTPQQSPISTESQQRMNKYPQLSAALNFSSPPLFQQPDRVDKRINYLWTPPNGLSNQKMKNAELYSKTSTQTSVGQSNLMWTPEGFPPRNNSQTGTHNLTSNSVIVANVWKPDESSPANAIKSVNGTNMSVNNVNQSLPTGPTGCRSVIKRHVEQRMQRRTELLPVTPIATVVPPKKYENPPFTFAQMIFIAITNSPNHCATPDAIWDFIVNTFPFYKDHYHMKKLAIQVLSESFAFEEAYSEKNTYLPPPMWFVKRSEVKEFVRQIRLQTTTFPLSSSEYMINADTCLNKALASEYQYLTVAASPPIEYSTMSNQEEEVMVNFPQENFEDHDVKIVEEIRGPIYREPLVSSTTVDLNVIKTWDKPPLSQAYLAAFVVANAEKTGLTCPAICEMICTCFPAYQDQKDTFQKRLYATLTTSRFFVKVFNGGLPFSIFYLNIGNEKAMEDLMKEFRKFLFMSPACIQTCMANSHELEAIRRKILGTNYYNDRA